MNPMQHPEHLPADLWHRASLALIAKVNDPQVRHDLRAEYEHLAAVCEYDGGLDRPTPERVAFNEVRRRIEELGNEGMDELPQIGSRIVQ